MKNYLIIALVLFQVPVVFGQDTLKKNPTTEEIRYLNIVENGYGGNIILEVVDENNIPVTDYRSVLRSGDEIVFDVPQPGPRATFFKDGSGITVQIEKKGYETYFSKPITVDDQMEMACVIKIVLKKKE
jgi:hypothetical protein